MPYTYVLRNGRLRIESVESQAVLWEGLPCGYPVATVLPIDGTEDAIVLLEYDAAPPDGDFNNLLRCRPDGGIVWIARLPTTGNNAYLGVEWEKEGQTLRAHDWAGWTVAIDASTGAIQRRIWTK